MDRVEQTPHSVTLYERHGKRWINLDLKDMQERVCPKTLFTRAADSCPPAALRNVNVSPTLLVRAKDGGIVTGTDISAISDLDDAYHQDFMRWADVLFPRDEQLPWALEEWADMVTEGFAPESPIVGLGPGGAPARG